jgi:predicted solute-binding protein
MATLLARESRADLALDRATLDQYLAMYANDDTLDAPADVRRAIAEMYARAHAAGLLEAPVTPEFSGG